MKTSKKYKYLLLYYFHHLMKNISLGNMHVDNVPTILYDCLQQLKYSSQIENKWAFPIIKDDTDIFFIRRLDRILRIWANLIYTAIRYSQMEVMNSNIQAIWTKNSNCIMEHSISIYITLLTLLQTSSKKRLLFQTSKRKWHTNSQ